MGGRTLLKSNVFYYSRRNVYRINGIWEKYITPSVLKDIESHWKLTTSEPLNSLDGKRFDMKRNKKYILSMFPYPSGNLHMGHVRVYTIADVLARFHNMKGYEVIHPMGWDAFGLPAENAAIERGISPSEWTYSNIKNMREQLKKLGCCFDWSREFSTCDPLYYKWTQFIFLKLFDAGMVYRQEALVNWDPVDQTVLANEQVSDEGCSWRSGAKVEKKLLRQWFIRTTKLSEALYEGLSDPSLDNWKDISLIQKHWIGECNGYNIRMKIHECNNNISQQQDEFNVWMGQPEDLNRIAFLAVRPGNTLDKSDLYDVSQNNIKLLKVNAIEPLSGRLLPILVVENLPYIDELDVYIGLFEGSVEDNNIISLFNFEKNMTSESSSSDEIVKYLKEKDMGGYKCSSKLKDWLISRQRYWGTPIPIVYCDSCGTVPVPETDLPVKLPNIIESVSKDKHILKASDTWLNCSCPRCGKSAKRETDTMDTFVDSSWYFLRYLDPHNESSILSSEAERDMPVDIYIGGKEHAILHLYFARFVQRFLHSEGLTSVPEPFKRLLTQGEVVAETYRVVETGKYVAKGDVNFETSPPKEKGSGMLLEVFKDKMSKSKFNGVDPLLVLDEYGIDATRLAIISEYGPQSNRIWSDENLQRAVQILSKIGNLITSFLYAKSIGISQLKELTKEEICELEEEIFENRNFFLIGASHNFINIFQFHTTIKYIQQLSSSLRLKKDHLAIIYSPEYEKSLYCLLRLLHPFCPNFTSEVWDVLNSNCEAKCIDKKIPLCDQPWPETDKTYQRNLKCKVNDKDQCIIKLNSNEYATLTHDDARELALKNPKVIEFLAGKKVVSLKYVHLPEGNARINFNTMTKQEYRAEKKKRKKEKAK